MESSQTASLNQSQAWTSHEYLTNLFGDEFLDSIQTITTKNGSTDYLDRVESSDFVDSANNPVYMAKGIDQFDRHFITMGLCVTPKSDPNNTEDRYYIYTLFRRYTESDSIWVMCKSHYSKDTDFIVPNLLKYSMTVTNEAYEILKRMIHDFKNGNNGIELQSETWKHNKNGYVNENYVIKFYRPVECS